MLRLKQGGAEQRLLKTNLSETVRSELISTKLKKQKFKQGDIL